MVFCRFGLQEQLTIDQVRDLINRKEIKPADLLQSGASTEWKPARDFGALTAYFGGDEPEVKARKPIGHFTPQFSAEVPGPAPEPRQILSPLAGRILWATVMIVFTLIWLFTSEADGWNVWDIIATAVFVIIAIGFIFRPRANKDWN